LQVFYHNRVISRRCNLIRIDKGISILPNLPAPARSSVNAKS